MLRNIKITNYALIDHLQINFEDGFSVITGETGSGKSILLGALGLILGERAEINTVRNPDLKCIVEAKFSINFDDYSAHFEKHDLDFDQETIIRREISTNGKSRAFINDTPVSLTTLKEFGEQLVDIHSQHETLLLNDSSFILEIIDSQCGNHKLLQEYRKQLQSYQIATTELSKLEDIETKSKEKLDYTRFLLNEFEGIDLQKFLDDDLENEYILMSNAEDVKSSLNKAIDIISGDFDQKSILTQLRSVKQAISSIANLNSQFQDINDRIGSIDIELSEIARDCQRFSDHTEVDQDRINALNNIISAVNRLIVKHQLTDAGELLQKKSLLETELEGINSIDTKIAHQKQLVDSLYIDLKKISELLSEKRKNIVPTLETEAKQLLGGMNMINAEIKFEFTSSSNFNQFGTDQIQILVRTNLGSSLEPLKKIASGGESSRIMLAIKALQSQNKSLPTIIFDEIDTGVSGEVARKMGEIMSSLGEKMQVISITHLPQIASKGKNHYKVFKTDQENTTITNIVHLNLDQSILELAEMLSGKQITDAAISNAKELLGLNN